MRNSVLWAFFGLFSVVCADLQAADVHIPEALDVVQVDGVAYKRSLFARGDTVLTLGAGAHRLLIRFNQIFESGDQLDKVQSDEWRVQLELPEQARLSLQLPAINSAADARRFVEAPQLTASIEPATAAVTWQLFTVADKPVKVADAPPAGKAADADAAGQLRYWWQKASAAEQQQFLREVNPER